MKRGLNIHIKKRVNTLFFNFDLGRDTSSNSSLISSILTTLILRVHLVFSS